MTIFVSDGKWNIQMKANISGAGVVRESYLKLTFMTVFPKSCWLLLSIYSLFTKKSLLILFSHEVCKNFHNRLLYNIDLRATPSVSPITMFITFFEQIYVKKILPEFFVLLLFFKPTKE